jgi:hypothetical protein
MRNNRFQWVDSLLSFKLFFGVRDQTASAGGADIPPCGTVKKPGQAMDGTR